MRTLLVIASLWANADLAATKQPVGPWLAEQFRSLSKRAAQWEAGLDKWAASTQGCIFDIRVVALADEAAAEIRFAAGLPETPTTPPALVKLRRERGQTVERILPHILAAGHARDEAQHTLATTVGRPATAAQYIKTPVMYVDANGAMRTGLTLQIQGDQLQLTTGKIAFASTDFAVSVLPDRTAQPARTTVIRENVRLGESLVIFRDVPPTATQPTSSRVVPAAAVEAQKEPPRPTLFIITPRRGLKGPSGDRPFQVPF